MQPSFSLDPKAIRRSFARAARTFDNAAVLHREVRSRMFARLEWVTATPKSILDLGCATGQASRFFARKYPQARVFALDRAFPMLTEGRRQMGTWRRLLNRGPEFLCADAHALPFRDGSIDWIFSNLMLPWCDSLDVVLSELRRVLKPRGVLAFSSFGPDTLHELRRAWRAVDEREHVHAFVDMHDLGDALVRAGFAEPVLDVEHFTLTYRDAATLLRDLKASGSINALEGRSRGLSGRSVVDRLTAAYETFRANDVLPATYEVVYGHAWQSDAPKQRQSSGEVTIPVHSIRRSIDKKK